MKSDNMFLYLTLKQKDEITIGKVEFMAELLCLISVDCTVTSQCIL